MDRQLIGHMTLSILSVMLALGIAEGVVRLMGYREAQVDDRPFSSTWAKTDPVLGWVNRRGTFVTDEPGNRKMTFQPDGSRHDPELEKKSHMAPEVIVIGCSYTQGYGLFDGETFSSMLNRRFPKVRFINFGTGGYGAYQSLLRLKMEFFQRETKPQMVIYGFVEDHLQRDVVSPEWANSLHGSDGTTIMPPHIRLDLDKQKFREYPQQVRQLLPLEKTSALLHLAHNVGSAMRNRINRNERLAVSAYVIREMQNIVTSTGGSFLLVGLDFQSADVELHLRSLSVDYADCRITPQGLTPEFRLGGYAHPNEKANESWAACITDAISRSYPL